MLVCGVTLQILHLSSVRWYMEHTLKIELEHIFHASVAFIATWEKLASKTTHFSKPQQSICAVINTYSLISKYLFQK